MEIGTPVQSVGFVGARMRHFANPERGLKPATTCLYESQGSGCRNGAPGGENTEFRDRMQSTVWLLY
jgi:hypothetical protein